MLLSSFTLSCESDFDSLVGALVERSYPWETFRLRKIHRDASRHRSACLFSGTLLKSSTVSACAWCGIVYDDEFDAAKPGFAP